MTYSQYKLHRRTLRRFIAACFIVVILSLWAWIKIDERCSRNEAERMENSVEKTIAESRSIRRLPDGD